MEMISTFSLSSWKYRFGNFGPKIQNCLFKMKFFTQNNLNTLNPMLKFPFFLYFIGKTSLPEIALIKLRGNKKPST